MLQSHDEHKRAVGEELEFYGYLFVLQLLIAEWKRSISTDRIPYVETCASVHCESNIFSSHEEFLAHVAACEKFKDGLYYCPKHAIAESIGVLVSTKQQLTRNLSTLTKRVKRICDGLTIRQPSVNNNTALSISGYAELSPQGDLHFQDQQLEELDLELFHNSVTSGVDLDSLTELSSESPIAELHPDPSLYELHSESVSPTLFNPVASLTRRDQLPTIPQIDPIDPRLLEIGSSSLAEPAVTRSGYTPSTGLAGNEGSPSILALPGDLQRHSAHTSLDFDREAASLSGLFHHSITPYSSNFGLATQDFMPGVFPHTAARQASFGSPSTIVIPNEQVLWSAQPESLSAGMPLSPMYQSGRPDPFLSTEGPNQESQGPFRIQSSSVVSKPPKRFSLPSPKLETSRTHPWSRRHSITVPLLETVGEEDKNDRKASQQGQGQDKPLPALPAFSSEPTYGAGTLELSSPSSSKSFNSSICTPRF